MTKYLSENNQIRAREAFNQKKLYEKYLETLSNKYYVATDQSLALR